MSTATSIALTCGYAELSAAVMAAGNVSGFVTGSIALTSAEDPAVGAAGTGMLGAAQGGKVGLGSLAEGNVPGGRGEAPNRSHGRAYQR